MTLCHKSTKTMTFENTCLPLSPPQSISSMKEALGELSSGKATVLSQVSAPYRIANVSSRWKEFFGLEEAESVGRSIKVRERKEFCKVRLMIVHSGALTFDKLCQDHRGPADAADHPACPLRRRGRWCRAGVRAHYLPHGWARTLEPPACRPNFRGRGCPND